MSKNTFETQIRVRYGETDQMGFVYYGNYALYLEQARTEMLRSVGYTYKEMEEKGVLLPVVNMDTRFIGSGKYDDLLTIRTYIKGIPNRKIIFYTEIFNEQEELLNKSEVILVFMNPKGKVISCPQDILDSLKKFVQ
ncbi:MAG: acyl-CoA thioester hydrolase [Planctomycetota bacterium]|jgi:acyl-CoA thioester hydrolase